MLLLAAHLTVIAVANLEIARIPIYVLPMIAEVCFLLSSFMLSVMPFTVIYTAQTNTAYFIYFIETLLLMSPKVILNFGGLSQDYLRFSAFSVSLVLHFIALVVLIFKTTRST